MSQTKLIVLRGPSASGKSTASKMLFNKAARRTVLIEQDHYRFMFKPAGGGTKPNSTTIHKMIKSNTLFALKDGYDVILEGILSVKAYGQVLEDIFTEHPEENYIFYFDTSLEETLKRHTKKNIEPLEFGEPELRKWYPTSFPSGHKLEQVIPETFTPKETVEFIEKTSKL